MAADNIIHAIGVMLVFAGFAVYAALALFLVVFAAMLCHNAFWGGDTR